MALWRTVTVRYIHDGFAYGFRSHPADLQEVTFRLVKGNLLGRERSSLARQKDAFWNRNRRRMADNDYANGFL